MLCCALQVVGSQLAAANLGWHGVFLLLNLVYFVVHYAFAAQAREGGRSGVGIGRV